MTRPTRTYRAAPRPDVAHYHAVSAASSRRPAGSLPRATDATGAWHESRPRLCGADRFPGLARLDALVDDVQPLMVSGEHPRPDPALVGEPGQRPAGDIAGGGGHLQAVDLGPGGYQHVEDLGHAEQRRLVHPGPAGHAARIAARDGVAAAPCVAEHPGKLPVPAAGG